MQQMYMSQRDCCSSNQESNRFIILDENELFYPVIHSRGRLRKAIMEVIFGLIFPFFDIGSDIILFIDFLVRQKYLFAFVTLFFILLPGLVYGIATYLTHHKTVELKDQDAEVAKVLIMPFAYPFLQFYMSLNVIWDITLDRKQRAVEFSCSKLRQHNTLEGFLESAPQLVFQCYNLFTGEIINFDDIWDAATRDYWQYAKIGLCIFISFVSLIKNGITMSSPETEYFDHPPYYTKNSVSFKFYLTLFSFLTVCVTFRVVTLVFLLIFSRYLHFVIALIIVIVVTNVFSFLNAGTCFSTSLILSFLCILMPNGYLLCDFFKVFKVNLTQYSVGRFLLTHMLSITGLLFVYIIIIMFSGAARISYSLTPKLFSNCSVHFVQLIGGFLIITGLLSLGFCYIHWKVSICPLYKKKGQKL